MMGFFLHRLLEATCAAILIYFGLVTYYSTAPINWWYQYTSISAVEPVRSGEVLRMVSRLYVYSPVDIQFNDVLRCTGPAYNDNERVKSVPYSSDLVVSEKEQVKSWNMGIIDAHPGSWCFVSSKQTIRFPLGVQRTHYETSVPFRVH